MVCNHVQIVHDLAARIDGIGRFATNRVQKHRYKGMKSGYKEV